ncbi:MAG: helix-turn-helix domain-containing protein [Alphaproteobacteria bacterium]
MIKNPALIELMKLMKQHNINQHQMAFRVNLPTSRISQLITEKRRFTIETDIKLCKLFSLSPLYFFNLQTQYELTQSQIKYKSAITKIIPL